MLYQDCERFDTQKSGNFLDKLSNCQSLTTDTYCMELVMVLIFFFYKTRLVTYAEFGRHE